MKSISIILLLGHFAVVVVGADYDGDRLADAAVFHPATGDWYIRGTAAGAQHFNWGWSATRPVTGDFDGDGRADAGVYWPADGRWFIQLSGGGRMEVEWGWDAVLPVPADYDGDGLTDIAVYWPASGNWYIRNSADTSFRTNNWGWSAALPIPADYDGDGQADLAVYWPDAGSWFIHGSASGDQVVQWGWADALPVPADYHGRDAAVIAVYARASGNWYIRAESGSPEIINWGWFAAEPVPADYNGDGEDEPAVLQRSTGNWYARDTGMFNWGWRQVAPVQSPAWRSDSYTIRDVQIGDVRSWAYNIQDVDTARQHDQLVGSHFDMYVLEPVVSEKGKENFDIAGLVGAIRQYNMDSYRKYPLVLAYADIGQAEDWRWYWQADWTIGSPAWIVAGDPDGWEGNYPVAFWNTDWRDIVIGGAYGDSHLEIALRNGFDGLYLDWVEAFSDERVVEAASQDGIADSAAAMLDFIEQMRIYARTGSPHARPDFLLVAQNASDLHKTNPDRYESLLDAIALEGIWYDGSEGFDEWNDPGGYNVSTDSLYPGWTGEVLADLQALKGRMPIFCCEYAQNAGSENRASEVYQTLAPQQGFIPYCTRRSLQQLSKTPYPSGYLPKDY